MEKATPPFTPTDFRHLHESPPGCDEVPPEKISNHLEQKISDHGGVEIPEDMTSGQYYKLKGVAIITICYHARYLETNKDDILKKRPKMKANITNICQAN